MFARLTAAWQFISRQLHQLASWLHAVFIGRRFAKLISSFLAEVGVLIFVFPGLEIIIRNEPNRLKVVIAWSWAITALCLAVAAIISMIGEVE